MNVTIGCCSGAPVEGGTTGEGCSEPLVKGSAAVGCGSGTSVEGGATCGRTVGFGGDPPTGSVCGFSPFPSGLTASDGEEKRHGQQSLNIASRAEGVRRRREL